MTKTSITNGRVFNYWFLPAALTFLTACSFHQAPLTLLPVGPEPEREFRVSTNGYLMVYSAWDLANDYNGLAMHHSSYSIRSESGIILEKVPNRNSSYEEAPQRVALAPGTYEVMALAGQVGKVIVPVVIKERETTCVYLDSYDVPGALNGHRDKVVTLPDGKIVGWSANRPQGGQF